MTPAVVPTGSGSGSGSSGDRLLEPEAERSDVGALAPYATVLTPELREAEVLRGPRIDTPADHGTGCTFAAAITAVLAGGLGQLDHSAAVTGHV
jgi:hydroxymethylpyrimidine/phosphomethylpyrimidine kinase